MAPPTTSGNRWKTWLFQRLVELRQREGQIFLVLALVIGAPSPGWRSSPSSCSQSAWECGCTRWEALRGGEWCFRSLVRSVSGTCCIAIFLTRVAAACHRPRRFKDSIRRMHCDHKPSVVSLATASPLGTPAAHLLRIPRGHALRRK